jgi:hypothetical protein
MRFLCYRAYKKGAQQVFRSPHLSGSMGFLGQSEHGDG